MSEPEHVHAFVAPVLLDEDAFPRMHYLPVPAPVAEALGAARVRRLVGTLNGHPFRLALQHRRTGERYLLASRALLRAIGAAQGSTVAVELRADPDPDRIDLGEAFEEVLRQDEAAAARFYALTPGRQRSLAHYATSAKRVETQIARALDLARKLRTNTLYGDAERDG